MGKSLICGVMTIAFASLSYAGGTGLIIKGVSHSWDEIARMALKVSGRELTDDAVKSAARTIEHATGKYGDDVARASIRGGVEVAEQTMKRGGRFFGVLQKAAQHSDEALRALALNADDMVKYSAKYGDDVIVGLNAKVPGQVSRMIAAAEKSGVNGVEKAVRAVSNLPADDISRVLGAVEKNPSVAREFLEHIEKGGKYFVDKVFEVNAKQILAGTLGAGAIVAAVRETAPSVAEGKVIEGQGDMVTTLVGGEKPLTVDQKDFVKRFLETIGMIRILNSGGKATSVLILAIFAGVSLLVFAIRKSKTKTNMKENDSRREIPRGIDAPTSVQKGGQNNPNDKDVPVES